MDSAWPRISPAFRHSSSRCNESSIASWYLPALVQPKLHERVLPKLDGDAQRPFACGLAALVVAEAVQRHPEYPDVHELCMLITAMLGQCQTPFGVGPRCLKVAQVPFGEAAPIQGIGQVFDVATALQHGYAFIQQVHRVR